MTLPPYWPPVAPPVRPTSGLAVAALICGLAGVSICPLVVPSLAAVILGHMAMNETKSGARGGHGLAIAGMILGYVLVVPAGIWLSLVLLSQG